VHTINYRLRLKGDNSSKGPNFASLKLKVVARCGDPKLLANAMKSYLGVENLNTRDSLTPPNTSLICDQVPIVSHIELINEIVRFLALTLRQKNTCIKNSLHL
jgi:hypothetical protein